MFRFIKRLTVIAGLGAFAPAVMADSYRYMHVSIETPWTIFIFLMVAVLFPFFLMGVLYWKSAMRRNAEADAADEN